MAIAFDTVVSGGVADIGATRTWSHTCSGLNRFLVVGLALQTGNTCTGVTYNGVAMTQIVTVTNLNVIYLFALLNPASGANNVIASFSNATLSNVGVSQSYTGVKQSQTLPDASASSTTLVGNTIPVTITTVADNCWGIMLAHSATNNPSSGTNYTQRVLESLSGMGDTNGVITPPGSFTMTVNMSSGAFAQSAAIFSFAPDVPVLAQGAFLYNLI